MLRVDTRALHVALNAQRRAHGLNRAEVAAELPSLTPPTLSNLATGPQIGFPRVMLLTEWLGQPAAQFVRVRARSTTRHSRSGGARVWIHEALCSLEVPGVAA